jgi:hypothetical protein
LFTLFRRLGAFSISVSFALGLDIRRIPRAVLCSPLFWVCRSPHANLSGIAFFARIDVLAAGA